MAIEQVSKTDLTGTPTDLPDVAADDSDLASANIPVAIGTPPAWEELPMANLLTYLNNNLMYPTVPSTTLVTLWESTNGYQTEDTDESLDGTAEFDDYQAIRFVVGKTVGSTTEWITMTIPEDYFNQSNHRVLIAYDSSRWITVRYVSNTVFQVDSRHSSMSLHLIEGIP